MLHACFVLQRGVAVSVAVAGALSSKGAPPSLAVKDQQTSNIKQAIEFLREAGEAAAERQTMTADN